MFNHPVLGSTDLSPLDCLVTVSGNILTTCFTLDTVTTSYKSPTNVLKSSLKLPQNKEYLNFQIQGSQEKMSQQIHQAILGAFGKSLAWYFISVTDLQNLSCLLSF